MTRVRTRRASYADIERLPEHLTGEIIDGELVVSPRPGPTHALASSQLGGELHVFSRRLGDGGPGGWWILDEPELHFPPAARPRPTAKRPPPRGDVLVPDLAGWRRERLAFVPRDSAIETVPDWVCEVLSPSTARIDRSRKLRIYAKRGVANAWLVDPLARTLEVLRLVDGKWLLVATFADDEKVRAEPFDAVELPLSRWWLEEEAPATTRRAKRPSATPRRRK